MVDGMATTKKYTVTLPEELAEAIREKVGPGNFSAYVTQAIERQQARERLHDAVEWWESEYGAITDEELAEAEAERRRIERRHAELAESGTPSPGAYHEAS
jgi:Arc/MetJ-type ribon-helix-helix transcriptional regulator